MTIPAGHKISVIAQGLTGAADKILQAIVERVADMGMAVRIGGAIMIDKALAAFRGLADFLIKARFFPRGNKLGLFLG